MRVAKLCAAWYACTFVHALALVLPQILTARRKHEQSDTEGGGGHSSSGWSDSDDSSG